MYRKLHSIAVPVLLILLTAGAVQARPLRARATPSSVWAEVWQLPIWQWIGIQAKEGEGMDPNGNKSQGPASTTQRRGSHPDRAPVGR
jgi:hypothetical protein